MDMIAKISSSGLLTMILIAFHRTSAVLQIGHVVTSFAVVCLGGKGGPLILSLITLFATAKRRGWVGF